MTTATRTPSAAPPPGAIATAGLARRDDGTEPVGSPLRCTRRSGASSALRELFVPSHSAQGCTDCGQPWSMSLRHLSLYCALDDVWAERGCTVPGCSCPAGVSRPPRPSGPRR